MLRYFLFGDKKLPGMVAHDVVVTSSWGRWEMGHTQYEILRFRNRAGIHRHFIALLVDRDLLLIQLTSPFPIGHSTTTMAMMMMLSCTHGQK